MDIRHYSRASQHLSACKEKLTALSNAPNFEIASRLWSEFLVEHQRWFTRMQQALEKGPSAAWLLALKKRRKSEKLLQYLHQARHADEHGLENIANDEPGGIGIGVGGKSVRIDRLIIEDGVITELIGSQDAGPIKFRITQAHMKLNSVDNRGVRYYPPIEEKSGQPYSVIRAASECLIFMQNAFCEAEKFFEK